MSCNQAFNIKNKPVNATWEIEEAFCLSTKDLKKADLAGKYFLIYNAAGTKYKVWFDDGVATEPVVADSTELVVDIAAANSAAAIATAIDTAIDAVSAAGYTGEISGSTTVKFIYDDTSKVDAPVLGTAGSLLQLSRVQIGGSIDLGLLDGDVTFAPTTETQDVTAHQTGAVVQAQLITSVGGNVSLTLKEYLPSRYRAIYEALGGKVGAVTGFGSNMVGKNLLATAKRLKLKPVGATDETETYTIWKAVPSLGDLTFSGENPNTLPMEFTAYIDDSKDTNINVWAYGDISTLT